MLQLLAVGGGQAGVLIDALWNDAPPARPEDQLAVLVSRLRSVLGRDRIDLVFGWRLRLKHRLPAGRLALLSGDAEGALVSAEGLAAEAAALGVPRYTSVARLLAHRANRALGRPADPAAVEADLDLLDRSVAIEAWWWTCDVAADFGQPAWRDRAADRAGRLARAAGDYADGLRREADRRLDAWPCARIWDTR